MRLHNADNHFIHQTPCFIEAIKIKTLIILDEITNPLIMNLIGPTGVDKPVDRALDQKVANMKGVENAVYGFPHPSSAGLD
jgi:hypothetical protein